MPAKCISQMCICGRHRCPKKYLKDVIRPHPIPHTKLPASEYIDKYKRFEYAPPRSAIRPNVPVRQCDVKMETVTTASESYKRFQCEKRLPRAREMYRPPTIRMLGASTYKGDYCDSYRMMPVTESFKPKKSYKPPTVPVNDTTMHKESYRNWDAEEITLCRGVMKKPVHALPPSGRPFIGLSTFQEDFRPPKGVVPVKGKGHESTLCLEGKHHMDTTHLTDFTVKPIHVRTPYKSSGRRIALPAFKSITLYQNDYRLHKDVLPVESYRPNLTYEPPEQPMEGKSIHGRDYLKWPTEGRKTPPWAKKEAYKMPLVPLAEATTYNTSYKNPPPGWDRIPSKRPAHGVKIGDGRSMESKTCHQQDFVAWDVERRESVKLPEIYKPPRQRMLTESIYTSQYRGQYAPPADSMKPKGVLKLREGRMEDITIYQDSYRCPITGVCPAALIHSTSPTGEPLYRHVGSTLGHEYFVKAS